MPGSPLNTCDVFLNCEFCKSTSSIHVVIISQTNRFLTFQNNLVSIEAKLSPNIGHFIGSSVEINATCWERQNDLSWSSQVFFVWFVKKCLPRFLLKKTHFDWLFPFRLCCQAHLDFAWAAIYCCCNCVCSFQIDCKYFLISVDLTVSFSILLVDQRL